MVKIRDIDRLEEERQLSCEERLVREVCRKDFYIFVLKEDMY